MITEVTDKNIEVGGYALSSGPGQETSVIGFVTNIGSEPIYNIQVSARLDDPNGEELVTGWDTYLKEVIVAPGVAAPFRCLLGEVSAQGEPYVEASADDWVEASSATMYAPASGLAVADEELSPTEEGANRMVGMIVNEAEAGASEVVVLATAFDESGEIVDTGRADIGTMAANSSMRFELLFLRPNATIGRCDSLVLGFALGA